MSEDQTNLGYLNALRSVEGRCMLADMLRNQRFLQGSGGDYSRDLENAGVGLFQKLARISQDRTSLLIAEHFLGG